MRTVRTNGRTIFLGWSAGRSNPRPWAWFTVPRLMINAYDFANRRRRKEPFARHYAYSGEVFCDSGGYQVLKSGAHISPSTVLAVQEQLGARLNAALDHPLDTKRHFDYFTAYCAHRRANPTFSFVPVIPQDLPKPIIERMAKLYPDAPMIAIGKVVPALFPLRDSQALRDVIDNVFHIRECFPSRPAHILGVGGVTSTALLFLVAESVDSSSWLHDARYGKIRIAGGGLVAINRGQTVRRFLDEVSACDCPACRIDHRDHFGSDRLRSFQARALHNAWTLLQEIESLRRRYRLSDYLSELEHRMRKSPWHRKLFGLVDQILKRRSGLPFGFS